LALGLGSLYRFTDLAKKPLHTDEAILALKTQEFWQSGTFEYDPKDYHGPVLHHLTRWVGTMRGWTADSLTEYEARWVIAVCGLLLVLSPLLFLDVIGRTGAGLAALLLAVSPLMTYYSRYYIMEVPFVLETALFIAFMWRWAQSKNHVWLVPAGVTLGLMHATKETFVLNVAALAIGWSLTKFAGMSFTPKQSKLGFGSFARKPLPWLPAGIVLTVALLTSAWIFSNGFKDWQEVQESFATYESYLGRSAGKGHEKPWDYYLTLLCYRQQGFLWSEGLISSLAIIGVLNAYLDNRRADHKRAFLSCFATYTIVLLGIYCAIPYKTPWSILGVAWALALMAGLGARAIFRAFSEAPAVKLILALALAAGVYHLCQQTSRATDYAYPNETRYAASELHNPYAYSHTSPNLVALAGKIHELTQNHPDGKAMPVQVIQAEQGWPLPWYLRDMTHVGYQAEIPETLNAAAVVTDVDKEEAARAKLGGTYESTPWGLRPGVNLALLVQTAPPQPAPVAPAVPEPAAQPPAPAPAPPEPTAPPAAPAAPMPTVPTQPAAPAMSPTELTAPQTPALPTTPVASPAMTPPAQLPEPAEPMVPKAELVIDEPELVGPPFPVPAPLPSAQ
ncbi:MAG: flippase activity-associated protein Agl23, partial [Roseimicrobium sp.]